MQSQAPAKPEPDPLQDKNFRGIARLVANGDPITDTKSDVCWGFHTSNNGQKGDYITNVYGAPAAETIEPGDYIVVVKYGYVEREFPFKVEKGKTGIARCRARCRLRDQRRLSRGRRQS